MFDWEVLLEVISRVSLIAFPPILPTHHLRRGSEAEMSDFIGWCKIGSLCEVKRSIIPNFIDYVDEVSLF
jgi:hypothetical protein